MRYSVNRWAEKVCGFNLYYKVKIGIFIWDYKFCCHGGIIKFYND